MKAREAREVKWSYLPSVQDPDPEESALLSVEVLLVLLVQLLAILFVLEARKIHQQEQQTSLHSLQLLQPQRVPSWTSACRSYGSMHCYS